ncbi:hypothetical protein HAX54_001858, partial [Datura stramonium]|nr:hypothetical protein [Datura stramonium]
WICYGGQGSSRWSRRLILPPCYGEPLTIMKTTVDQTWDANVPWIRGRKSVIFPSEARSIRGPRMANRGSKSTANAMT